MKIALTIPYGTKLIVDKNPNSGVLLQAIIEARLIEETGYGKDRVITFCDNEKKIDMELLPDDFNIKESDPVMKLRKEKEVADSRWIEYYNKSNAFEAELKTLKQDLDNRGIHYTKPEVKA